ncbi:MAG: superoxide dismutase family protein [Eubacteriales bacterium]
MQQKNRFPNYLSFLRQRPQAWALVRGSSSYPDVQGSVRFYTTPYGTLVAVRLTGLPDPGGDCEPPIFAFHIHEGESCTGTPEDPFANVRMHYNPYHCPHPYHAGDLPPLFGAGGNAFAVFLTGRFRVEDIVGRSVIVHAEPDDFTTQPSGNSGAKIACGEIRR